MKMHIRQQVRNKITELLKTIPDFNGRVFESRVHQLLPSDLPCALVFSESEVNTEETKNMQPRIQKRLIETAVYLFATANDLVENACDVLSELVEQTIFANPTLGETVFMTYLQNTVTHVSGEPNVVAAARLSFISIVHTVEGIPQRRT